MGVFADAAPDLARRGLAVLPLGGAKGQTPLMTNWTSWKRQPRVEALVRKFPDAQIGVNCKFSRVTVVDIDDLGIVAAVIDRLGDTPLKTRSPRGCPHLWYRSSGEGCEQPLRREGLQADIKGIGGYVVAPPSIRLSGEFVGQRYGFLAGSWDDLVRLPVIRPGALRAQASGGPTPLGAPTHNRNVMLFHELLRHAVRCDDCAALLDVAETLNGNFNPSLEDGELAKVAASAWKPGNTKSKAKTSSERSRACS
jgi:hypothetical protein